mmetsp:Transcript_26996/g.83151  ORF Transcript_26996/g.83151 Transcript_26996/m.83151 type:complete len:229 (-) Transcript_26996:16-702(-)
MTPLFCEKVVLGGDVKGHAKRELKPSARRPPWTRDSKSSPLTGSLDAAQDMVTSPIVSAVDTKKPMRMGQKYLLAESYAEAGGRGAAAAGDLGQSPRRRFVASHVEAGSRRRRRGGGGRGPPLKTARLRRRARVLDVEAERERRGPQEREEGRVSDPIVVEVLVLAALLRGDDGRGDLAARRRKIQRHVALRGLVRRDPGNEAAEHERPEEVPAGARPVSRPYEHRCC